MILPGISDGNSRTATMHGVFGRFAAVYGILWMAVLIGFAGISYPLMKKFAENQIEERLRTNAALIEEYISSLGAYSEAYRPVLAQVCRRLSQPNLLDAQVTLFSPKAEAIADSRLENPLIAHPGKRPEIDAALNKEVGASIRYSELDRRRMAFVAFPHVHLGKVESVIRVGVPYASIDSALWVAYFKIAVAGLGLAVVAAALSSLMMLYRDRAP
jgi:hypothetical protein